MESSVCIDFDNHDETGSEFLADLYDQVNALIDLEDGSCKRLSKKIIKLLVRAKIVLPEAARRRKINKVNREFGTSDIKAHQELQKAFGKIKPPPTPKGSGRRIYKEELVPVDDNSVTVSQALANLSNGSMWIETGKMTGGSRNILDLSKTGRRSGKEIFGSVSFFDLDPHQTAKTKVINVRLANKKYLDNPIFFAEDNSNWRIQLKGETTQGEKLTTISKPELGKKGGFVNKILVFTKAGANNYTLEVLDEGEIETLKSLSAIWGRGGRSGTGRHYGVISEVS